MSFLRIILFLTFFSSLGFAQTPEYKSEISLINDNDVYLFANIDRYYSNGIFINYRFLKEDSDVLKKTFELALSQLYWTPQDLTIQRQSRFERPYAGILQGAFRVNEFREKSRFSYGVNLGVIGSASGAQIFQENYHRWFGFPEPVGWGFQIQNGLVLDLKASYNKQWWFIPNKVDLISSTNASLGTIFNNLRQEFDIRIGNLRSLKSSAFFNALFGETEEKVVRNAYFFLGHGIEYVFHNTTIQGHVFEKNPLYVEEIVPWVRHIRTGIGISSAKTTFKLAVNWLSKEVRYNRAGRHAYVRIELALRLAAKTTP